MVNPNTDPISRSFVTLNSSSSFWEWWAIGPAGDPVQLGIGYGTAEEARGRLKDWLKNNGYGLSSMIGSSPAVAFTKANYAKMDDRRKSLDHALAELERSAKQFHMRFGTLSRRKPGRGLSPFQAQARVFAEEVDEFTREIRVDGYGLSKPYLIAEEAADALVTVVAMASWCSEPVTLAVPTEWRKPSVNLREDADIVIFNLWIDFDASDELRDLAGDVIFTALNFVSVEELIGGCRAAAQKNDDKTLLTHRVDENGKVSKIVRPPMASGEALYNERDRLEAILMRIAAAANVAGRVPPEEAEPRLREMIEIANAVDTPLELLNQDIATYRRAIEHISAHMKRLIAMGRSVPIEIDFTEFGIKAEMIIRWVKHRQL